MKDIPLKEVLYKKSVATLEKNTRKGKIKENGKKIPYCYVCPSKGHYDQQWLWDSSYHAIVLSHYDIPKAKQEIISLLSAMRADGFMPNVIMWYHANSLLNKLFAAFLFDGRNSNITQPPVIGIAIEAIYNKSGDIPFLKQVLPKVSRFYDWFGNARDQDNDKLVSVIHPWETGIDSIPAFDPLLDIKAQKPNGLKIYYELYKLLYKDEKLHWNELIIKDEKIFDVEDVMFNCIYAQGMRSLARLYTAIEDYENAEKYHKKTDAVEDAILSLCWDEKDELFYDLGDQNTKLRVPSISSLFPIILDRTPKEVLEKIILKHLINQEEFWTNFPIPSVPKNHPTFNTEGNSMVLWRGPTWINTNWFIIKGLTKHGYTNIAKILAKRTAELMYKNKEIHEYYNPDTGEGEGQRHYSWSTLVIDLFDQID